MRFTLRLSGATPPYPGQQHRATGYDAAKRSCRGCRTSLLVLTACLAVGVAGPSGAQASAFEPNDSIGQATGPLSGGTSYQAAMETANDQDWYLLLTSPGEQQLDITLTDTAPNTCFGQTMNLVDADGRILQQVDVTESGDSGHIRQSVAGATRYYLQVTPYNVGPCIGPTATYSFRVDPAGALTNSLPSSPPSSPPLSNSPSSACANARSTVSRLTRTVTRTTRQLTRAHGTRKRRLRRRVASLRRQLRTAKSQRNQVCT